LEWQKVATATQRRGWNIDSVEDNQKSDLEKGRLIRARQRAIGRELRRMYDNVAKEPVPDDFLDLLHKIDEAGTDKGNKNS
jgi:hypothetical protein